ncbi:hypothetical protein QR680_007020 [Steinernema hermaphroditum]|uniref:Apple domain-containing protein n=1 Tax=Steinernema hermaphroditum TaxID=289476 RepID=A0AA39LY24_9BILA|nr:hypothetical protein QR680_007020 [Steinernema hermaphroditum]
MSKIQVVLLTVLLTIPVQSSIVGNFFPSDKIVLKYDGTTNFKTGIISVEDCMKECLLEAGCKGGVHTAYDGVCYILDSLSVDKNNGFYAAKATSPIYCNGNNNVSSIYSYH